MERDKLIEKLKEKKAQFDNSKVPELAEGTIWLENDELGYILTSLTAPVTDGKVKTYQEIEQWVDDNESDLGSWDSYLRFAKWIQGTEIFKTPDVG